MTASQLALLSAIRDGTHYHAGLFAAMSKVCSPSANSFNTALGKLGNWTCGTRVGTDGRIGWRGCGYVSRIRVKAPDSNRQVWRYSLTDLGKSRLASAEGLRETLGPAADYLVEKGFAQAGEFLRWAAALSTGELSRKNRYGDVIGSNPVSDYERWVDKQGASNVDSGRGTEQ